MDNDRLFRLVEEYSAFGDHRTGTAPDLAACGWFFEQLEAIGATCERRNVVFDRFDASARLTSAAGEPIACEPVYYSALGSFETRDFAVAEVTSNAVGNPHALDQALGGDPSVPVVVAIDSPADMVRMPNRPIADCTGPAAVVVPADRASELDGAVLGFEAQLVPGICEASSAVLGPADGRPVVVTTPLSGWYQCAGERGTGIAVALDLVESLSADHRVTVVACSGHELAHTGLVVWLDDASELGTVPAGPVIHLGASVASLEPDGSGGRRFARRRAAHTIEALHLDDLVEPAGFVSTYDPRPWLGEGGTWRNYTQSPVLSFAGHSHWFHTPGDVPANSTSAEALGTASRAVRDAVHRFLEMVGED